MFFDVHVHVYRSDVPLADGATRFPTLDEVLRRHDEAGIHGGFVLPLIGPETYLPQSNEDVLDICAASGGRLLPFCNIDPRAMNNAPDSPLGDWLAHYKARGCKGIGEVMANLPVSDPRYQNLFRHAEALGLPINIDMTGHLGKYYGLYDDPGMPQFEATLARFPKLIFLGHGPAFWAEIAALRTPDDRKSYPHYPVEAEGAVPRLMRQYPSLYGDLSAGSGCNALTRDPAYAARFLNEFQDRLLFGTDLCSAGAGLPLPKFLLDLRTKGILDEAAFEKIAWKNAVRLFGPECAPKRA